MSVQQPAEEQETSRHVTVLQQLKDTDAYETGDRFIVHGERLDDRYKLDEERRGFVPVARPIAIIDVGVELTDEQVTEWSNSHAGEHVLQQYFPEMEVEDPTLPDAEELMES